MQATPDDPIDALTIEDRQWLVDHGWIEPPPRPHWDNGELVVTCRECAEDIPVDYIEVETYDARMPRYIHDAGSALERHGRTCPDPGPMPTGEAFLKAYCRPDLLSTDW